jgi:hypothetical protein
MVKVIHILMTQRADRDRITFLFCEGASMREVVPEITHEHGTKALKSPQVMLAKHVL